MKIPNFHTGAKDTRESKIYSIGCFVWWDDDTKTRVSKKILMITFVSFQYIVTNKVPLCKPF